MDKYTTDLRLDEINVTGGDYFIENWEVQAVISPSSQLPTRLSSFLPSQLNATIIWISPTISTPSFSWQLSPGQLVAISGEILNYLLQITFHCSGEATLSFYSQKSIISVRVVSHRLQWGSNPFGDLNICCVRTERGAMWGLGRRVRVRWVWKVLPCTMSQI